MSLRRKRNEIRSATGLAPLFSSDKPKSGSQARRIRGPSGRQTHQLPTLIREDPVFYDRRDDSANTFSHVYYTFSTDRGRRFAANTRLTSKPSDSRIGRTYPTIASAEGLVDFGSRLGLLSRRSGVVAAWPDTRNGALDRRQDIFSAKVAVPEGRRTAAYLRPLAVGVALVIAGGVVALGWHVRRKRMARGT